MWDFIFYFTFSSPWKHRPLTLSLPLFPFLFPDSFLLTSFSPSVVLFFQGSIEGGGEEYQEEEPSSLAEEEDGGGPEKKSKYQRERERIDTRYRFFVPPICLRSLHLIFQLLQHSYTHYSNLLLYTDQPTKVTTERNHCCQTDQDQRRQLRSTILLSVATFLLSFIHLDFFIFGPS